MARCLKDSIASTVGPRNRAPFRATSNFSDGAAARFTVFSIAPRTDALPI